ncbi:hypothetical protein [uncultured Microbulbifer sp.]|uniref:hypothetical protein n=1 Tax=uncultured Microbulbifer sp. TaxID=348147 RepID=UPI00260DD4F5|nr:hypothetical protein [uncultured Microbulbifer sp.]
MKELTVNEIENVHGAELSTTAAIGIGIGIGLVSNYIYESVGGAAGINGFFSGFASANKSGSRYQQFYER